MSGDKMFGDITARKQNGPETYRPWDKTSRKTKPPEGQNVQRYKTSGGPNVHKAKTFGPKPITKTDDMSLDVLSLRMFCLHGHFVPQMFFSGCFVPMGVLSAGHLVPLDGLSHQTFCHSGRFAPECFVSGRFVSGVLSGHHSISVDLLLTLLVKYCDKY
jgi:hypothetical protein